MSTEKRKSNYDLQTDMKSYLLSLHSMTKSFVKAYKYEHRDHQNDNIIYVKNRHDLTTGIHDGLATAYTMQRYKIKEQRTLRPNTKNYIKKYYADNMLNEIECFVDGKFDCRLMAAYSDNKRYLIPVSESGMPYTTYTHVSEKHENYYEEYMVNHIQIVYNKYTRLDKNRYAYLYINYVLGGTYPIVALETGVFGTEDQITYMEEQHYDWYMEFDAERKGKTFHVSDILMKKFITPIVLNS